MSLESGWTPRKRFTIATFAVDVTALAAVCLIFIVSARLASAKSRSETGEAASAPDVAVVAGQASRPPEPGAETPARHVSRALDGPIADLASNAEYSVAAGLWSDADLLHFAFEFAPDGFVAPLDAMSILHATRDEGSAPPGAAPRLAESASLPYDAGDIYAMAPGTAAGRMSRVTLPADRKAAPAEASGAVSDSAAVAATASPLPEQRQQPRAKAVPVRVIENIEPFPATATLPATDAPRSRPVAAPAVVRSVVTLPARREPVSGGENALRPPSLSPPAILPSSAAREDDARRFDNLPKAALPSGLFAEAEAGTPVPPLTASSLGSRPGVIRIGNSAEMEAFLREYASVPFGSPVQTLTISSDGFGPRTANSGYGDAGAPSARAGAFAPRLPENPPPSVSGMAADPAGLRPPDAGRDPYGALFEPPPGLPDMDMVYIPDIWNPVFIQDVDAGWSGPEDFVSVP